MDAVTVLPSAQTRRADFVTMGVVGSAHFTSHVLQVALAPVLPMMSRDFDVTFTQLGLVLSVLFAASGAGQVMAGVLVDRFGAHRLLIAGVALQSLGMAAMGLAPTFAALIPFGLASGLGNAVYHPADLSILSRRVSSPRLGRAFAVHAFSGTMGFAASPIMVAGVASVAGWRAALVFVGVLGLVVAACLAANRTFLRADPVPAERPDRERRDRGAHPASFARIVAMPVVLLAFTYFVLTAFAGAGIQTFAITALTQGYGLSLALATLAVTAYQLGSAAGVLAGGVAADRSEHHHRIAMAGLVAAAVLVLAATQAAVPTAASIALLTASGFAGGLTAPSRDILVRRAAPDGGLGKVFGVVYSGFDFGNLAAPLVFGALLDRDAPNLVFVVVAAAFGLATLTVLGVGRRSPAR